MTAAAICLKHGLLYVEISQSMPLYPTQQNLICITPSVKRQTQLFHWVCHNANLRIIARTTSHLSHTANDIMCAQKKLNTNSGKESIVDNIATTNLEKRRSSVVRSASWDALCDAKIEQSTLVMIFCRFLEPFSIWRKCNQHALGRTRPSTNDDH